MFHLKRMQRWCSAAVEDLQALGKKNFSKYPVSLCDDSVIVLLERRARCHLSLTKELLFLTIY